MPIGENIKLIGAMIAEQLPLTVIVLNNMEYKDFKQWNKFIADYKHELVLKLRNCIDYEVARTFIDNKSTWNGDNQAGYIKGLESVIKMLEDERN